LRGWRRGGVWHTFDLFALELLHERSLDIELFEYRLVLGRRLGMRYSETACRSFGLFELEPPAGAILIEGVDMVFLTARAFGGWWVASLDWYGVVHYTQCSPTSCILTFYETVVTLSHTLEGNTFDEVIQRIVQNVKSLQRHFPSHPKPLTPPP
jgi:hypothetical protein